jgi:hypothetical protein
MLMTALARIRHRWAQEAGFTMLFALLALFVGSLLVAAAFTAADGDIDLSNKSSVHNKAYYAAQAGVQRYLYELQSDPNYWVKCPEVTLRKISKGTLETNEAPEEEYKVVTLPSKSYEEEGHTKCKEGLQASVIETSGLAAGTFRVLITSKAGTGKNAVEHKIVATFSHPGFTKYVYESNYEVEDPTNFSPEPTNCEHYYKERVAKGLTTSCPPIEFAPEDKVNGPMHTNDAADICAEGSKKPVFGRKGYEDAIEMLGGHYASSGCSNSPEILGKYTEEAEALLPPETDGELLESAGAKFSGRTEIVLKAGTPNTMSVTNNGTTTTKNFPSNGVVYVENSSSGCSVSKYSPFNSNTETDQGCGNVYVSGTYTESLTIASADDVIVNGNLTTTGGSEGEKPTGGATLGLIAENFVRVYHPVKKGYSAEHYTPEHYAASANEIKEEECGTIVKATGKITNGKTEVKEPSSVAGIVAGMEVTGTGMQTGEKVSSVKSSAPTSITLEKNASFTGTSPKSAELVFYKANNDEYRSGGKICVEPPKTGYTFHEAEVVDSKSCESSTTYASNGFCEYENDSKTCSSKATNLNASEDPNKWGSLEDPIIDAAILSTKHSWIVDNYKCGAKLGELTVWGSIAQFWRGPVGTGGGSGTGYIKNYNYDQRLATEQPPSFLSPISTSWKLVSEREVPNSFTN